MDGISFNGRMEGNEPITENRFSSDCRGFLPAFVFVDGRVSLSELELSDDELDDRRVARLVSLSDDDEELVLSDRLNVRQR